MDSFTKWVKTEWPSLSYNSGDRVIAKQAYIAGLRRAAEIARENAKAWQSDHHSAGAYATADDIEAEARRIEGE